jgi:hypothetical protein
MLIGMIGLQSCDSDDNIVGGSIEPELVGCEAADLYDWDTVEFSTSLDGGADSWIAFNLEELTYFTVFINQPGFLITMYALCDGELGGGDALFQFQTDGNSFDVGIAPPEDYYLNILNTRPGRLDFTFSLTTSEIIYGCMDNDAINYDETANIDDGGCVLQDCITDYWVDNYGEMINDCDGNCAPTSWIGDTYCDDGAYGVYDEDGNLIPVNLMCNEFNWDEGDCEEIIEGCTEGLIEDCNGICAPADWLGDGFCDDGSYEYNGSQIYFNCDEYNNDEGDCDELGRTTQQRPYPNGRIRIN